MALKVIFRILFSILLLLSVLFMPFWLTAILALFGMAYWNVYAEGVALLLLSDLIFGAEVERFQYFTFVSTSLSLACLIFIEFLKKKMRVSHI